MPKGVKAIEEKWWMCRYSSTVFIEVRVTQHIKNRVKWHDGTTLRSSPIDDGYTSFHPTKQEAIDHKIAKLKRSIELLTASGDTFENYQKQLEEMSKYE